MLMYIVAACVGAAYLVLFFLSRREVTDYQVEGLLRQGVSPDKLEWFGLEYRYVGRFLSGSLAWGEMHDQLVTQIRRFAKRQDIWFRKLEREGHPIHWIPRGDLSQASSLVRQFLSEPPSLETGGGSPLLPGGSPSAGIP